MSHTRRRPAAAGDLVRVAAALLVVGPTGSCSRASSESPAEAATKTRGAGETTRPGVVFVPARPQGDVVPLVVEALAQAERDRRTLVVYVGATWCEPCQRFHQAATHGELDAQLPALTLLEFDLDRDHDRLIRAGYAAKYIPLFVLPQTSGVASGHMLSGGIKGDGAVGFIAPRLKELLER